MNLTVRQMAERSRGASRELANASSAQKDAALLAMAEGLCVAQDDLLSVNATDVAAARERGTAPALVDRLTLTPARIAAMADGIHKIAGLPDPIGEALDGWTRPNGLEIQRVRVPLGVIGIIYESRPNVTADAAALCLKAGSACLLRGGSDALASNSAIATVLRQ